MAHHATFGYFWPETFDPDSNKAIGILQSPSLNATLNAIILIVIRTGTQNMFLTTHASVYKIQPFLHFQMKLNIF